jgi:hypothetical protein
MNDICEQKGIISVSTLLLYSRILFREIFGGKLEKLSGEWGKL